MKKLIITLVLAVGLVGCLNFTQEDKGPLDIAAAVKQQIQRETAYGLLQSIVDTCHQQGYFVLGQDTDSPILVECTVTKAQGL